MADKLTRLEVCLGECEPKCGKCGIVQEIELTPAEIADYDQRQAQAAAEAAQREADAKAAETAKASAIDKLTKLGLTADEIAALTK